MRSVLLIRQEDDGKQTLGTLKIFNGIEEIFSCCTLEPSWKFNQTDVSCIPEGNYRLMERISEKYRNHLRVMSENGEEVFGRDMILVHSGNFRENTRGCILPGKEFIDIDGDGFKDVTSSRDTLQSILKMIVNGIPLKIVTVPSLRYF